MRSISRFRNLLALLIFLFLTALAGRHVLTHLDTVLVGNDPDAVINP